MEFEHPKSYRKIKINVSESKAYIIHIFDICHFDFMAVS